MSAPAKPQHLQALGVANVLRLEGAHLRKGMGAQTAEESRRRAAELLRNPPPGIAHMRIGHFLVGIRRFGHHRAMRCLSLAGVSGTMWDRRVGPLAGGADSRGRLTLTYRHREALAEVLEAGA